MIQFPSDMKIKILGDKEKFLAPTKGTEKSAAYDLYVQEDVVVKTGRQIIPTGFAIELDPGTAAEIRPRSGYSSKGMEGYQIQDCLRSVNAIEGDVIASFERTRYVALEPSRFNADVLLGLVDEDFRNETGVIIKNNDTEFLIKRGTRIAQMLIVDVPMTAIEIVEELSESGRKGGFGSTNV